MSFQVSRRVLLGIVLVLFLGGPTPGAVGDCSEDEGASVAAPDWCFEKGGLVCERRAAMTPPGPDNDAAKEECYRSLDVSCPGSTWPLDCVPPTRMLANACIAALSNTDRLSEPESAIVECQVATLCGGGG